MRRAYDDDDLMMTMNSPHDDDEMQTMTMNWAYDDDELGMTMGCDDDGGSLGLRTKGTAQACPVLQRCKALDRYGRESIYTRIHYCVPHLDLWAQNIGKNNRMAMAAEQKQAQPQTDASSARLRAVGKHLGVTAAMGAVAAVAAPSVVATVPKPTATTYLRGPRQRLRHHYSHDRPRYRHNGHHRSHHCLTLPLVSQGPTRRPCLSVCRFLCVSSVLPLLFFLFLVFVLRAISLIERPSVPIYMHTFIFVMNR